MKGFLLFILAIIVLIIIGGGVFANHFISDFGVGDGGIDSGSLNNIIDKLSNIASSGDSNSGSSSSGNSIIDDVNDIVSEEVKFNSQNGEGYYREVTYKDGGFRQYDTESGELIGSSYESDQNKLPSME